MKTRVSKNIKQRYKKILNSFISDLSRPVAVFKKPIRHECPNCFYDKLTNTSTNMCRWTLPEAIQKQHEYEDSGGIGLRYKYFSKSRCPICKGKGVLETIRKQWVDCKVNWDLDPSDIESGPSGLDNKLLVELKVDPKYVKLFSNCDVIKIDDIPYKLFKPPILRGKGNDSVLVIIAFTDQITEEDLNDVTKDYE